MISKCKNNLKIIMDSNCHKTIHGRVKQLINMVGIGDLESSLWAFGKMLPYLFTMIHHSTTYVSLINLSSKPLNNYNVSSTYKFYNLINNINTIL